MDEHAIERHLAAGERHLAHGWFAAAIESFRQALSIDPSHADAHALLALALHDGRRLHAAELEAGRAITEAPDSALPHLAMAQVLTSKRQWSAARGHLDAAFAFAPDDSLVARTAASIHLQMGRPDEAWSAIERALALAPDDAPAHALAGLIERRRGDRAAAAEHARKALVVDAGHPDALVLRGWLHLDLGEVELAREAAASALREEPSSQAALRLLVGVKMRQSRVTGLWWRFNTWAVGGKENRTIVILVGLYVAKQLVATAAADVGFSALADVVDVAWLAFCAYTWFAPTLFQRALAKELDEVELRDDF